MTLTTTATSSGALVGLALVAYVPQKPPPRVQSFASSSSSSSSPVLALQWSRLCCSSSSTRELGSSRCSSSSTCFFSIIHKDAYLVDGAPRRQEAVLSYLQEPTTREEGRRIWWQHSRRIPNENKKKKTIISTSRQHQQRGIWRTKALERRREFAVESDWEREEARWLREEQRWLREEERWRREETRWTEERKAWAQESLAMAEEIKAPPIAEKRHALHTSSSSFTVSSSSSSSETDTISKEGIDLATHSTASMSDFSIDLVPVEEDIVSASFSSKTASGSTTGRGLQEPNSTQKSPTRQRVLKRGTEGAEVRALQEALAKLGYYSGEEEIEYSSFARGTEAAAKAWQVSVGAVDDGIMSSQLLAQLYGEENPAVTVSERKEPNGQASSAKQNAGSLETKPVEQEREIDRFSTTDDETGHGSRTRVYLLGENRWEDSSRLIKRSKGQTMNSKPATVIMCFSCRGEGVTLCTECEGTGDLNVEEQFLEWVEENAKCPYCEGSGSVSCDVCLGGRALKSS
ncbi:unnamed protein product [Sphagnum jensenii]|uniref:Peptidoglycan binding-like domain-containing protein n=1 Tax=Sphagnum jensenii TaxID=128206 RepID=A0ABP0WCH6_9BRYO